MVIKPPTRPHPNAISRCLPINTPGKSIYARTIALYERKFSGNLVASLSHTLFLTLSVLSVSARLVHLRVKIVLPWRRCRRERTHAREQLSIACAHFQNGEGATRRRHRRLGRVHTREPQQDENRRRALRVSYVGVRVCMCVGTLVVFRHRRHRCRHTHGHLLCVAMATAATKGPASVREIAGEWGRERERMSVL